MTRRDRSSYFPSRHFAALFALLFAIAGWSCKKNVGAAGDRDAGANADGGGTDADTGTDIIPPAAVVDLVVSSCTSSSCDLTWTAPGDDGSQGVAASYDVRYSMAPITESNWDSATEVSDEPPPQPAGSIEALTGSGLSPDTTYYFAVKTSDEVPNVSAMSNVDSGTTLFQASRLLNYGFEDWGGDIASTPGYIFTSIYSDFCTDHENASEVVTSYDGWTPHSGSYFFLQGVSPCCPLDPAVSGIPVCHLQAANNIGSAGDACGDNSFNINTDITTGEIFIRFWARHNVGFATIQDGGRCKWIFVATDTTGIFMHLSTDSTPAMYFYHGSEGYWLGSAVDCPNAYNGSWHKWSFYIDFNNGEIYGWYDIADETKSNFTKHWAAEDGQIGTCTKPVYMKIQGNFSAKAPTEETYFALDDVEVWDGMPSGEPSGE